MKNNFVRIAIGLLVLIACIVPVTAVDYTYWDNHYINILYGGVTTAANPYNITPLYSDSGNKIFLTNIELCAAAGKTALSYSSAEYKFANTIGGVNSVSADYYGTNPNDYGVLHIPSLDMYNENGATYVTSFGSWGDGTAVISSATCYNSGSSGAYYAYTDGKFYVYHATTSPVDYNYPNLTINVIDSYSFMPIARADVGLNVTSSLSLSGKTDIGGVIEFLLVASDSTNSNKTITASKVGYNTTIAYVNLTNNTEINVYLNQAAWNTSSGNAIIYLDIVDATTNAAITGATIGIKNTTAEVNPWYYATYPNSTIAFSTDGTYNLSVGQSIEFAGYKSGSYEAGHTDPIYIISPVTRAELRLTNSSVINPIDLINVSFYWYPVTIVDATTGNTIAGSNLNYEVIGDGGYWHNTTSSTGKFNITGKGPLASLPLENGDTITLEGNASGYQRNGFALLVDNSSNGVTQVISLLPTGYSAIPNEFTALISVYDSSSTAPLSNVGLNVNSGSNSSSKTTSSSGTATFKNLTAGDLYTVTASKSGYSTTSKTFTGGTGSTVMVEIAMSPTSVNPTATTTTILPYTTATTLPVPTTSANGTYTGFFGPLYDMWGAMGAKNTEIGILMTLVLVFIGVVVGGFGTGAIIPGAPFNISACAIGGIFGFTFSCILGFISIVWIVVMILLILFYAILLR